MATSHMRFFWIFFSFSNLWNRANEEQKYLPKGILAHEISLKLQIEIRRHVGILVLGPLAAFAIGLVYFCALRFNHMKKKN